MNSPTSQSEFAGALGRGHWDVPIRVRLAPYVDFSRWLDGELEKLVTRWADRAAPGAKFQGRR
jgi:hypothetical protein